MQREPKVTRPGASPELGRGEGQLWVARRRGTWELSMVLTGRAACSLLGKLRSATVVPCSGGPSAPSGLCPVTQPSASLRLLPDLVSVSLALPQTQSGSGGTAHVTPSPGAQRWIQGAGGRRGRGPGRAVLGPGSWAWTPSPVLEFLKCPVMPKLDCGLESNAKNWVMSRVF